jgi:diguanylate cyclase (GGDEF)-like protein/PAS domain S-box-containing protein
MGRLHQPAGRIQFTLQRAQLTTEHAEDIPPAAMPDYRNFTSWFCITPCRAALLAMCWLVLLASPGVALAVGQASIAAPATLRVALDDNYPPFIMRKANGALEGYLVDQWKLWESKTGVRVEFIASDWAQAQKTMAEGRADVLDTLFQTPERAHTLDFSPAYAQIPVAIYTSADLAGLANLDALQGFQVGVKNGDACVDKLSTGGIVALKSYPSYEALVQAAIANKIRVFCMDEPPANYLISRAGAEQKFLKAFTLYTGEFHRAVRKGDVATLALLQRGFSAITVNEQRALHDKWMGLSLSNPLHRNLYYALIIAAALILMLAAMTILLRLLVKRRTADLLSASNRLQGTLDALPDLMFELGLDGRYYNCHSPQPDLLPAPPSELLGKTLIDVLPPDVAQISMSALQQAHKTGYATGEYELALPQGKHWFEFSIARKPVKNGQEPRFIVLSRDITERQQAELELRIAAVTFESQESIMITDANRVILRVNQAFTEDTGYTAGEITGKTPRLLRSGRHKAGFYRSMWEIINRTGAWQGEIWDQHKNGTIYPKWLTITAVRGHDGIITHYVGTHLNITERKSAEDKIQYLAFYDSLTRLPNRRLLMDRLQQALASSERTGRAGSLLLIDLDNFKNLNDTLGHVTGDLLLQQVTQRLETCIREGDTVARLGGDEFVLMLLDLNEQALEAAAQTEAIGKKVLATLNQPYQLGAYLHRCTVSIGAALFKDLQQTTDELMKQTDIAMYQAKKAGRNTLRFFDPQMQASISARVALEGELHQALEKQQFHLHYQIQMDGSLCPLGAEALIRWIHPERGMVSPAHFIPLAEETGLILPIGQWVIETACAQLKVWQQNVLTQDLILSVNVSAKQFCQADFVAQVQAAAQRHAINPMRLKLELTEGMLLENINDTIATMNALNNIGVQFSLDDFGTGYSSLQYLKQLPLDQLKIDQSFVRDIATNNSDIAIVRTIVAMARSLDMEVIAEGVETEEQRLLLLKNGCSNYQGYLFGRPLPIEQFEASLTHTR